MREKGYTIVSFDGNESLISSISLNVPPTLKRHRPDLIGVNLERKKICIGEAKTPNDLHSKRTKEQFADFSNLLINESDKCELIIGILKESENLLKKILYEIGLLNQDNVSYVWVPEVLLSDVEESRI